MTRRYALMGHPVGHSASPALHNHWFERYGLDAVYTAIDLPPERAPQIAEILRRSDLDGANLTVPFKAAALESLDQVSPLARAAGSVNTVWREGARLCGDSTDAPGFVDALLASGPLHPDLPAAILGTGGAGRAVAAGLAQRGWTAIALFNANPERARAALAPLALHFPRCRFSAAPLEAFDAAEFSLVASCVSAAGRSAIQQLPIAAFAPDGRWCDLNYWDPDPPHRDALGPRFDGGHGMLVHQAALAFARWTGITPDVSDLPGEPR